MFEGIPLLLTLLEATDRLGGRFEFNPDNVVDKFDPENLENIDIGKTENGMYVEIKQDGDDE